MRATNAVFSARLNVGYAERLCGNSDFFCVLCRSVFEISKLVAQLEQRGPNFGSFWHLLRSSIVFTQPPDKAAVRAKIGNWCNRPKGVVRGRTSNDGFKPHNHHTVIATPAISTSLPRLFFQCAGHTRSGYPFTFQIGETRKTGVAIVLET